MSYCIDDCCHPGKHYTGMQNLGLGTISPQVRTHHMIIGFLSSNNLRKLKAQGIATLGCVDTVFVKGSVHFLVVIIIRHSDAFCDCPNIIEKSNNYKPQQSMCGTHCFLPSRYLAISSFLYAFIQRCTNTQIVSRV